LTLKHKVQGEIYIGLSLQEEEVLLDILIRTSEQLLGMRENLKSRKLVEIMRFIIQKQHPDLESNSEKISKMSPALQQTLLHSLVVSTIQSLEDIDKKDRQTLSPAIVASKMIFSILRDHCAVRFSSLKLKMCKTWINFSISSVKPNLGTLLEKDVRKFALFAADSLKNSTEMTTEEISLFRKCMMFNCNSFFREQLWEKCFKNCTSLVKTNMSTDQTHVLLLESLYRKVQENYAESDFEEAYVCFENVSTFLLGRNPPSISAICLVIEMVSNVTRKLLELKPLSQFCEKVWAWCLNILQRIKQLASNLDDHEQLARSALACALHLKKRDSISSCIQGLIKAHNSNPNSISIKGLQKVVQLLVSHSILAEHRDIHESLTFLKYAQQFCKDGWQQMF
jgi:ATP-dependent exoDNAse (exonuclease V) alpha subunit